MRRGFVMPIVILLALVVGIMAAVLLERQSAQTLIVRRELNGYRDHHFQRGVREVVGEWTNTLAGQPIEKLVDDDGHALDIQAADGTWLAVYLFDGQGSALSDPAGLTDEERTDAGGILTELALLTGDNPDPSMLRSVGPVKICLASATPEVIEAIGNYAGGRSGRRFVDSVTRAKSRGDLTQSDVDTAMGEASLTPEQRQVLSRVITLKPELWMMVIDVYEPARPSAPVARYGGRFVPPGGSNARASSALQSLGKFLSWDELPLSAAPGQ